MQNLKSQLNALLLLKNFVEQFTINLHSVQQAYQNKIGGLRDAGVSIQVADNYIKNFGEKNNKDLWTVIENFKENDCRYIVQQIEVIEKAIKAAAGSGCGVVVGTKANSFKKGIKNIKNIDDCKGKIIKKCVLCHLDFETVFADNNYCPECFKKLLDSGTGSGFQR